MIIQYKSIISLICLLFALIPGVFTQEKTLVFPDPKEGWSTFSTKMGTTEKYSGPLQILALQDNEYAQDEDSELLLHFNSADQGDVSGNYHLKTPWVLATGPSVIRGEGAAVFQNRDDGIVLEGKPGSAFSPNQLWRDFTLEFWLYPANVQDGETIFLWKGAERSGQNFSSQEFRVSLQGRRVLWKFDRFFENYPGPAITLQGDKKLLPRTWHHHLVRFDAATGLLEYLLDGQPEASTHVTPNRKESAQVYLPRIGTASQNLIYIGPNLTAMVDEFRLTQSFQGVVNANKYLQNGGKVISRIIDLGSSGSSLKKITGLTETPGKTDLAFSYILTETKKYTWQRNSTTLESLEGVWQPFQLNKDLSLQAPRGRYLQIRLDFRSDGTGNASPLLRNLEITYFKNQAPPPPADLFAKAEDGRVILKWKPVTQDGLKGYRVFYGRSPRTYENYEDAGELREYTVRNLIPGELYYFAVVSYDKSSPPLLSGFSPEVAVRPEGDLP